MQLNTAQIGALSVASGRNACPTASFHPSPFTRPFPRPRGFGTTRSCPTASFHSSHFPLHSSFLPSYRIDDQLQHRADEGQPGTESEECPEEIDVLERSGDGGHSFVESTFGGLNQDTL